MLKEMSRIAYIGLGSNLDSPAGSPAEMLLAATESLATLGTIVARSSFYRTAPVGFEKQPAFVNAVVALRTDYEPEKLLGSLLGIERSFGRDRATGVTKGPRTLDLDLLLLDYIIHQSQSLILPHPELARRRFVLAPLVEIAPQIIHPVLRRTAQELLAELPDEGANRRTAVQVIGTMSRGNSEKKRI